MKWRDVTAEAKLLRCTRVRVDTTVVPASVAYPTDSGRLAEGGPPEAYLTELSVDDAVAVALRLRQERHSERRAAVKI